MAKPNGNGFKPGNDWKEEFQTKFIPYLMDCIGDADMYQHMYDTLFNTRRCIRGESTKELSDSTFASYVSKDENHNLKIKNIHVLYGDWYDDEERFQKTLKTFIGIYNNDPDALKEQKDFMSSIEYNKSWIESEETTEQPKEIESVAAYTPNTTVLPTNTRPDPVVQSMGNNIPEQNVFNSSVSRDEDNKERVTFNSDFFVQQSLQEIRNYLISYPEDYMPKSAYTIPTVLPPKQLLANKSTSQLVKRTSFEFMLDFNNDNLKDCLDKNAPTTINNITERFEEWRSAFGIPVIFSKLYTIFWNLLLITMDDDLYNKHLSEVVNLAHRLFIDENLLQDLCHGVEYVLSGKKLTQNCDLQCKTAEGAKFFLHK